MDVLKVDASGVRMAMAVLDNVSLLEALARLFPIGQR